MATFVKTPESAYVHIAQIQRVYVILSDDSVTFNIVGEIGDKTAVPLKVGFTTQAAAQTALDNAIVNLGGSI